MMFVETPERTRAAQRAAFLLDLAELKRDCLVFAFMLKGWRAEFLRRYSPDQPRVPAGNPDGGQWTSGGAGQTAQAGRRGPFGRFPNATPAQQARLLASQVQAEAAVARARALDPTFRRPESLTATIEGEIAHNRAGASMPPKRAWRRSMPPASAAIAGPYSIPWRRACRRRAARRARSWRRSACRLGWGLAVLRHIFER